MYAYTVHVILSGQRYIWVDASPDVKRVTGDVLRSMYGDGWESQLDNVEIQRMKCVASGLFGPLELRDVMEEAVSC
jgi:hypothetical protein